MLAVQYVLSWWLWSVVAGVLAFSLAGAHAATLTWDYTQDPNAPAVAIEIERRDPGQSFVVVGETTPDIKTFQDGDRFSGATCWRIRARGPGAWSEYSNTVCLPAPPSALMVK